MSLPGSAEEITKLLRARDATPDDICNIVSNFNRLDFYFPNKEVFVLELIQDRWNDQKKVEFKTNYHIWNVFNRMWLEINDDIILKKMFKKLKFTALLQYVLTAKDIDSTEMAKALLETCQIINATSSVEMSFDQACSALSQTILLILKTDIRIFEENERNNLISEIITLIGFDNYAQINHKLSISFCNELLLSILAYLVFYEENVGFLKDTTIAEKFSKYFGNYLFGADIKAVLLLEKVFNKNKSAIDSNIAIMLFEESNKYIPKNHFQVLETIFEKIISVQPAVVVRLLNVLSSSKKTLSHKFLQNIFNQTLNNAAPMSTYDTTFWQLIGHILDLDLEIGLENSSTLLTLIEQQKRLQQNSQDILKIWKKFLACYINARKYPKFLDEFRKYCSENEMISQSSIYVEDSEFASHIVKNIATLSLSQLKDLFSDMIDKIMNENTNGVAITIAKLYLKSLGYISYTILPDLKEIFATLFTRETFNTRDDLWEVRYDIMQTYDDIIPEEQISDITESSITKYFDENSNLNKDQLFFFLKLREFKDFDITKIEQKLIQILETTDITTRKKILEELFMNWSSLINSLFTKETISKLISILTSEDYISILNTLFQNDDIFEEYTIMSCLASCLTEGESVDRTASYILQMPIECLNKTARVFLLNQLSLKTSLNEIEFQLIEYLLVAPTFKSYIECDLDSLFKFMMTQGLTTAGIDTERNTIFKKILSNHISQSKEEISKKFISQLELKIAEHIRDSAFVETYFLMAALFITCMKLNDIDEVTQAFLTNSFDWAIKFSEEQNEERASWITNNVYYAINKIALCDASLTKVTSFIKEITATFKGINKDLSTVAVPLFLLHCLSFDGRLEIIYSQYMLLRSQGVLKDDILPAMKHVIQRQSLKFEDHFNKALISSVLSFQDDTELVMYIAIVELLQAQVSAIDKSNVMASTLFLKFISEVFSTLAKLEANPETILDICQLLYDTQIEKPWIFTQYSIEILFPFALKVNLLADREATYNDKIFVISTKIISNILNFNRIRISNRNNLVNSLLCQYLDIVCNTKKYGLSPDSAAALSRLIVTFCEPSNHASSNTGKNNKLSSNSNLLKKTVRKYIPVLLIKYVHLCISIKFEDQVRKEITPALYAILDLISLNELNVINRVLDNAGRQYFKVMYANYKKLGKWHES
ncbi:hypothetical protein C6P45_003513 [Maudiozyma exigua]|uniref:Nucleolar 27S pre-rRNA processing Urb2/Npa2 C-terminal domain-containing protein n=1 Tax=Maudiozyma exigua TaxID=34358 RepID=A0A9P7BAZ0_MAUEX|nr:hypothetical protein C6P45_003513 [Kazachstania exigua]